MDPSKESQSFFPLVLARDIEVEMHFKGGENLNIFGGSSMSRKI